ncbi:YchJ family metal-binding protein [Streptomyces sp. ODS28]|uniref:YchJ family protein n=1 Tax=Streptomyces sp. ODS28 TaxID=3136688 RepID=UPI0031EBEEC7
MSSRRSRRSGQGSQAAVPKGGDPCPCGLGGTYAACCGRLHAGEGAAATAEGLMRSRYSAFAARDTAYLLRTWHPDTRPPRIDLDPGTRWTGLEIVETSEGSAFHATGTVTFRAHFTERGRSGVLEERSRFARADGAWVYVDGEASVQ